VEKNGEVVDACEILSVRAANVARVSATVGRRVLPFVHDQTLVTSCIVEEERGH